MLCFFVIIECFYIDSNQACFQYYEGILVLGYWCFIFIDDNDWGFLVVVFFFELVQFCQVGVGQRVYYVFQGFCIGGDVGVCFYIGIKEVGGLGQ